MAAKTKICYHCKSEIPAAATKCAHCGSVPEKAPAGCIGCGMLLGGLATLMLLYWVFGGRL